jgi:hypothetical protein
LGEKHEKGKRKGGKCNEKEERGKQKEERGKKMKKGERK